jgi:anti-sigma regulatory factor (Ser/Thr protein kinase)
LREIALHLLDIVENSVAANAKAITLTVEEDLQNDRLRLAVQDDGKGMDEKLVARLGDPFATSRKTRHVGFGIPFLKAAAEACDGSLRITSAVGKGTRLEVDFQRRHIDRAPLGDLAGTVLTLVVAYPNIHWVFSYRADDAAFVFDNEPITEILGEVPLTEPAILAFVREMLEQGVAEVQRAAAVSE